MNINEDLYQQMQDLLEKQMQKKLSTVEFLMCSPKLKLKYITEKLYYYDSANLLNLVEYQNLNDDLKIEYIKKLLKNSKSFTFINDSSDIVKQFYIKIVTETKNVKFSNLEIFDYMTDVQKIEYILNRGFDSLAFEIKDWYEKWKVAKGRDFRIDKILLD